MRSKWVSKPEFEMILRAMTWENELALRVSEHYGVRIGDVLNMRKLDVQKEVWSFREQKTGKRRRVKLGAHLRAQLLSISGKIYVFENRNDPYRPRTRQAVYKDIRRVAKFFGYANGVTPHSARKIYSVEQYKKSGGNIKKVQQLLNHSDECVTMIYALADQISSARCSRRTKQDCTSL